MPLTYHQHSSNMEINRSPAVPVVFIGFTGEVSEVKRLLGELNHSYQSRGETFEINQLPNVVAIANGLAARDAVHTNVERLCKDLGDQKEIARQWQKEFEKADAKASRVGVRVNELQKLLEAQQAEIASLKSKLRKFFPVL